MITDLRLVVGVIGHVDHGKTRLVRVLTGIETDRLAEEQARGISIALGFAHVRVGDVEIDLIDMPGHERFVRTMVAGAAGIDAVLLMVDAGDGIMPQTREHMDIARLLGVSQAIVAISRTDRAEPNLVARRRTEAADLVSQAGLNAPPPIACSAQTGAGVDDLLQALADAARRLVPREDFGAPVLSVDRTFSIAGHGTVVTGTLLGGQLAVGDVMEVAPGARACRIRALQVHGEKVPLARPGQRVAVNLRAVEPAHVPRGSTLCTPGALLPADFLSVRICAVADAPPLPTGVGLRLLFGTEEVDARLRLLDCDVLHAGEAGFAQLRCARPVAAAARTGFVLRGFSPQRTVAGGTILDPWTTRQRRHAPGVLARLASWAGATPAHIVMAELTRAGMAGAGLQTLARLAGLGAAQTAACVLASGGQIMRAHAVSQAGLDRLQTELTNRLAVLPEGAALPGLMPGIAPVILEAAATRLLRKGILVRRGAAFAVRRPDHDARQARLAENQAAEIADALRRAGLSPPDAAKLAPDPARRRVLEQLIRQGVIIRAPDRVQKREVLFHRDAIDAARRALHPLLAASALPVSDIGAALGISRKYSVPLLEYLDSVHFTARVGERRRLANPT